MSEDPRQHHLTRLLATVLVVVWAATAIAIAVAYHPGGPVDVVVVLACFLPVLVAAIALEWPADTATPRDRTALVWVWIAALLFAVPVLYDVASTLAAGGPQILVPSAETAYAGLIALFMLAFFSVTGFVHARRGQLAFERAATWQTMGASALLTVMIAGAFGLVAFINDQALRVDEPVTSRFGPTDPDAVPPLCHEPLALGPNAVIGMTASSSEDNVPRGSAVLEGRRKGIDEAWGASWQDPDGGGQIAYLRLGTSAWLNLSSDDPEAPGTTWQEAQPGLFEMAGRDDLTMDGPPHALVDLPRGSIVAEDLGLERMEGARARHCRTFIDGPTALSAFLPLRWLLDDSVANGPDLLRNWRGQMDWWVFNDGQLGRATVEISGRRAETGWRSDGVSAVLEARLEATDRSITADVTTSVPSQPAPPQPTMSPRATASPTAEVPSDAPAPALESAAP